VVASDNPEVVVLGGIGAFLILVNGVVEAVTGAIVPLQVTGYFVAEGVGEVFAALVLFVCLVMYWQEEEPSGEGGWGTAIVVVSALSLIAGGGFLIGFLLAFVAGTLAIVLARLPLPENPHGSFP
jgi:glycerol uptake facilitator-like aquaporin